MKTDCAHRRKPDKAGEPLIGRDNLLHVVLLDAFSLTPGVAVFAAKTSADLHLPDVKHFHLVPCRLGAFLESGDHGRGIPNLRDSEKAYQVRIA